MPENKSFTFVPEVYIIESAHLQDYVDGPQEGRALQESLNLMRITNFYFPVFTKSGFEYVLNQIKMPRLVAENIYALPIIHISAHGAPGFFELTNMEQINWREFRQLLTPVNTKCKGTLILSMSVCHGFMAFQAANTLKAEEIPFFQLIGPKDTIEWQDSLLAFLIFYNRFSLLAQGQREELKVIINNVLGEDLFDIVDGYQIQTNFAERMRKIVQSLVKQRAT